MGRPPKNPLNKTRDPRQRAELEALWQELADAAAQNWAAENERQQSRARLYRLIATCHNLGFGPTVIAEAIGYRHTPDVVYNIATGRYRIPEEDAIPCRRTEQQMA